ncbi:MAG: DUF302 domain-containing protein [Desulfuromonadaceae bacterium]|nr:DUF302 domain-containing protein [Desulfuromonadaceae bacterium]
MSYHFSRKLDTTMSEARERVIAALGKESFGVLTEIDVQETLKKKIGVDWPGYTILGACNPKFAYEALQAEPHIGTMLPCNVILRQLDDGKIEVSAVDPIKSMQGVENPKLTTVATAVRDKLRQVIESL